MEKDPYCAMCISEKDGMDSDGQINLSEEFMVELSFSITGAWKAQ